MITSAQFRKLFPSCPARRATLYLPLLVAAMTEAGIVTRKRAAAFVAQLGHESADFHFMEEIASGAAYEGRKDLGNFRPGDGRRFKGRGPIQITGRLNYTRAGIALTLPLDRNPELLSEPANGFRASAWFWKANKLNVYADALTGRGDAADLARFDKTTKRVNGGYNGRVDRQRRYLVALAALTDSQFESARLGHTLDELTQPSAGGDAPQTSPAPEVSAQPQQPPAAATPEAGSDSSLLDEIPVTAETKAAGAKALRAAGLKVGTAVGTLWGVGVAGKLLVVLAVVVALVVLYMHRRDCRTLARRVLRKLKGGA